LNDRPIALLAANVLGDSLTLDRQMFSSNMAEWLERTVKYFAEQSDLQLMVRIHPGEQHTKGPSVADIVNQALQRIPENICLISADDQINTYDLLEIADLGLVYTTTVGLEMAMSGIPVIVVGQTHYGEKGFTFDPKSWEDYFLLLERFAQEQQSLQLTSEQVDLAWRYAYNFFFEFPAPFPWPMPRFWKELANWPVERVLSAEGLAEYGDTFRYLVGEPREWTHT
jgi:capsule polysaccharide export protein KpsC/LpsZ